MSVNADNPHLWKKDIEAPVGAFNDWFIKFAPRAHRDTRAQTTMHVKETLRITKDLITITPSILRKNPSILPNL